MDDREDDRNRSPVTAAPQELEEEEEEEKEGVEPFQESVVRFHLAMTDAKLAAAAADREAQQAAMRRVFEELGAMRAELFVSSGDGGSSPPEQAVVQEEMLADCERKAGEVVLDSLRRATSAVAPDPEAAPGLFYECVRLRQEAKVRKEGFGLVNPLMPNEHT